MVLHMLNIIGEYSCRDFSLFILKEVESDHLYTFW